MIVRPTLLRVGDIVGITNLSLGSSLIKGATWGWKYALDQTKAHHIAMIVDENLGTNYTVPDMYRYMEMEKEGIDDHNITKYNKDAPRAHPVFWGRHSAFDDVNTVNVANDFLWEARDRHIRYGFMEFACYILKEVGIHVHVHLPKNAWICSVLPRAVFIKCGIKYPKEWDNITGCPPMVWQTWNDPKYKNVISLVTKKEE